MQVTVVDTTGKSKGKITLPDEIFAVKARPSLLAQAVRVYLTNSRQGSAQVKSRGQIRGSGRKIWRQKGTGRARHGDRYAPIFVGGGIAHGPSGEENGLEKLEPRTKVLNETIKKLTKQDKQRASIIQPDKSEPVIRGARNIKRVRILSADKLNAFEILKGGTILLMKSAVSPIEKTFLKKERENTVSETKTGKGRRKTAAAEQRNTRKTIETKAKAKRGKKK
jgi:large subunit ribosomal protein L4